MDGLWHWVYHSIRDLGNQGAYKNNSIYLFGGLEHVLCFHILGIIIQTD